ncbi:MAG: hypothetical protein Q9191_008253 [Dirinaria sp. TL-2023a]
MGPLERHILVDRQRLENAPNDLILPQQSNHKPDLEPQPIAGAEDARSPEPECPGLVRDSWSASNSPRGSAQFSTTSSTTASLPNSSVGSSIAISDYPPGYGKLAAIEGCNPNFLIYRKFLWLHNRLLLHKQDELMQLERYLESLDQHDSVADPRRLKSSRRDEFKPTYRKDLLKEIDAKLNEYHALLLRMQQVHAIKRPTKRNQTSLNNFICHTDSQLSSEAQWISMGPDLAAVAHDQEYGWFQNFVEDMMIKFSKSATKASPTQRQSSQLALSQNQRPLARCELGAVFQNREEKIITGDMPDLYLLSPYRLDVLLRALSTIMATALLLLPIFILYRFQPMYEPELKSRGKIQFLTIIAFTLAFSTAVSVFTRAKRQEVFAATAAYCAVLVVFLGNTSNVITSSPP